MTLSVKFRKTDFKYSTLIGQTLIWNVFLDFDIALVHIFTDFWHQLNCTELDESYFYRFDPNYDMIYLLISSVDQNSAKKFDFTKSDFEKLRIFSIIVDLIF